MKILENILSEFKEILYDVIIYIIPGFICLLILAFGFSSNNYQSLIYSFLLNSDSFKLSIPPIVTTISFLNIFILIVSSYVLGTILHYLSNIFSEFRLVKFILKSEKVKTKLKERYPYLDALWENIDETLKNKLTSQFIIYSKFESKEKRIKFLKRYSSANSRFTSHNDLIQKYIAKQNFYSSLSALSLILLLDLLLSSIILIFKINLKLIILNSPNYTIFSAIFLFLFLFICLRAFYKEFYRHTLLRENECCLYIYSLIK